MTRSSRRQNGQSMVEFALAFPVFIVLVFAIFQFGLLFIWYYSETRMARESARWLAVHRNADDATMATHLQQTMLPGMVGDTPVLTTAGSTSVPTVYTIGRMTATFTPCLRSGRPATCTHPDRASGSTLFVDLSYDASHVLFFPASIRVGNMSAGVPTTLPPYRVYTMVE